MRSASLLFDDRVADYVEDRHIMSIKPLSDNGIAAKQEKPNLHIRIFVCLFLLAATAAHLSAQVSAYSQQSRYAPGKRVLMDAHSCYPYSEWWGDRINRALSTGAPLAIEQDLLWYTDPGTGRSWSIVTHGAPATGQEPTLESYFFDNVRPLVEKALKAGNDGSWPLITLNLDFKTEEPEHLAAILTILQSHKDWITTARRTADIHQLQPLNVRPILVLTGESDAQQRGFYDLVPVNGELVVFGAAHTNTHDPMAPPEVLEPKPANNYRRWWNNPWRVVEEGGQTKAGQWTSADQARLEQLVQHAHANNLWIRFYTLDGTTPKELSCYGWFRSYNFGSLNAAKQRWNAAYKAGVDYIASDQYELLHAYIGELQAKR
jgi:hypothetical protein